jgi:hypothetical protein
MTADDPFHYPPELLSLLIDTIPLLCRSKQDVLTFFPGQRRAGQPHDRSPSRTCGQPQGDQ